ncbi:formate dehydrogenase accessory sulfurtransferase FdhD [Xanthomonas cerealis pv. cerealis]|uniref:formate dehydrogenase accessory sulfurtransferase FdhD n=1 Tax=Xanthomonas cerealis TaxID=3390025 RepID=UPI001F019460|nr:formate dehydrogenase accessory sulfurtransferase FdhD [Xanthomonas translucens]UKE70871.1 formate dehydrogenase accessory sulfurtransferase FdhD [Xanthomonas translucens pv. pistacia]
MDSCASSRPGAVARGVHRHRDGRTALTQDLVASEVPVAFAYNGAPFVVMMATPEDLHDFALGFSLTEGIVEEPAQLQIVSVDTFLEGVSLQLQIPPAHAAALQARRRNLQGRSGCGVCGSESIEAVLRAPRPLPAGMAIAPAALARALRELRQQQPLNAITGATHAAGWADADGGVQLAREDVGRHNALDKLIGALASAGTDPASGFAVVTSRASYEMAMKAAQAGIPLLAAISAPTALAVALADSAGLTLIGFARDHDYVVYSHPQRLHQAEHAGEPA